MCFCDGFYASLLFKDLVLNFFNYLYLFIHFLQILQMQLIQVPHSRIYSINLIFLYFLKNCHQTFG